MTHTPGREGAVDDLDTGLRSVAEALLAIADQPHAAGALSQALIEGDLPAYRTGLERWLPRDFELDSPVCITIVRVLHALIHKGWDSETRWFWTATNPFGYPADQEFDATKSPEDDDKERIYREMQARGWVRSRVAFVPHDELFSLELSETVCFGATQG